MAKVPSSIVNGVNIFLEFSILLSLVLPSNINIANFVHFERTLIGILTFVVDATLFLEKCLPHCQIRQL